MRLGGWEIVIIIVIALLVFGGKKLAGIGKSLGTSVREFKEEVNASNKPAEEAKAEASAKETKES
ncbi:MAG: twin-arginine translocase TatA/TatE family subunit [Firmicutes bacterium]|nr:twin-arginine translocase TatA/TatE family subunit [Clostridiales bacterium]MBQ9930998.1 twin-arginine translocase TatA/TatE family subunit [Bacillota bacterium]